MIGPVHVGSFVVGALVFVAVNYFFFNFPSKAPAQKGAN